MQTTNIWLPLTLGLIASFNVALGGYLVFKFKKYFNIILGFAGGVMIATALFEVMPEIIELLHANEDMIRISMFSMIIGICLFHFLSKIIPLHEHGHHEDHSTHSHLHDHFGQNTKLGIYGAIVMIIHSFIDGFGIGIGFAASTAVGITVAIAVISHNVSDGINTVSTLIKNKVSSVKFKIILGLNILAPLLGVLTSFYIIVSDKLIIIYLSFFIGSILYLAVSDILPHAHSDSRDRRPIYATLLGIIFIFSLSLLLPHAH